MTKKVILYGSSSLSKMLFYDASCKENFEIACFSMDNDYLTGSERLGLPLVGFEEIQDIYPPGEYDMIVLFSGFNRMRERAEKYSLAKSKGYKLRNYISPKVDISPEITLGDNNVILGYTHIGIAGTMGNNNLIRQNVYLGHDFRLGNNITIVPGCNIGGHCEIKDNCFIGLGVTIVNQAIIEKDTLIGAGSMVIRNTEPYSKNVGNPSRVVGYHPDEGVRMITHDR